MEVEAEKIIHDREPLEDDEDLKPVCHIALFKFPPTIDEKRIAQQAQELLKIPGVVELHFGRYDANFSLRHASQSKGYTHAMFTRHYNGVMYKRYRKHPKSLAFRKHILHHAIEEPIVFNFTDTISKL